GHVLQQRDLGLGAQVDGEARARVARHDGVDDADGPVGERAADAHDSTLRMASRGAGRPVQRENARAPWWRSIASPPSATWPRAFASRTSRVPPCRYTASSTTALGPRRAASIGVSSEWRPMVVQFATRSKALRDFPRSAHGSQRTPSSRATSCPFSSVRLESTTLAPASWSACATPRAAPPAPSTRACPPATFAPASASASSAPAPSVLCASTRPSRKTSVLAAPDALAEPATESTRSSTATLWGTVRLTP